MFLSSLLSTSYPSQQGGPSTMHGVDAGDPRRSKPPITLQQIRSIANQCQQPMIVWHPAGHAVPVVRPATREAVFALVGSGADETTIHMGASAEPRLHAGMGGDDEMEYDSLALIKNDGKPKKKMLEHLGGLRAMIIIAVVMVHFFTHESEGRDSNAIDSITGAASRGWVVLDAGLSQARQGHGVAALGGVVYAAGGIDAYAKVLASVEAINGTDVLTMPSMLEPRYYFGFAAFGGRLFAAGGCGPGVGPVNVLSSVEAFDGRAWTSLPPLPAPRARMAAAATASALFLLGGCPARRNATSDPCDSLLASVLRFDDARNSWTQAPSLPRPNAWLSAAALGDSVYAVGGGLSYGRNETYRLDY